MNLPEKSFYKESAEALFDLMDLDASGKLDLEQLKTHYLRLPLSFQEKGRRVLRNFILNTQCFEITRKDFIQEFNKEKEQTPRVYLNLSQFKDSAESTLDEIKPCKPKRKPRFIKKSFEKSECSTISSGEHFSQLA